MKVLVASNDPDRESRIYAMLRSRGSCVCVGARSVNELLEVLATDKSWNLVIIDLHWMSTRNMGGLTGIQALRGMRARGIDTATIFVSADGQHQREVTKNLSAIWIDAQNLQDLLPRVAEIEAALASI